MNIRKQAWSNIKRLIANKIENKITLGDKCPAFSIDYRKRRRGEQTPSTESAGEQIENLICPGGKDSAFSIDYRKRRRGEQTPSTESAGEQIENLICPGGGIGRRVGLKIRLELNPVPVQVWPRAFVKRTLLQGSFFIKKY